MLKDLKVRQYLAICNITHKQTQEQKRKMAIEAAKRTGKAVVY